MTVFIAALYLLASGICFLAYARDKRAARLQERRTPERTLQTLALLGGWPGALLAQRVLRHKTRKPMFQIVFWGIVLLHLGALSYGALLLT
jgi:uncharacterized membrane protein YsdA (DUF1294 family)